MTVIKINIFVMLRFVVSYIKKKVLLDIMSILGIQEVKVTTVNTESQFPS